MPSARYASTGGRSRRTRSTGPTPRAESERGSGLLTSGIVATLLLLLLLLASQTLLLLQRSSLAEAVAFDAASTLATGGSDVEQVKNHARSLLGTLSAINVISRDDPVVVEVRLPTPGLLRFGPKSSKVIARTARVRREVFRPDGAVP